MLTGTEYWYNKSTVSGSDSLPPQAIPTKKKTKQWREDTMDALERIAVEQVRDNLKFKDFYRMIEGKMSFQELSEVIPQLREVEKVLDDIDVPTFLKHYDLIGIIINAMVGEYMMSSDKFNITNVDEISTTEYERTKQDLVSEYIKESIEKELNLRLLRKGINPDLSTYNIKDQEKLQQLQAQIEQEKQAMTPPEIEKFMSSTWRTKASIWGEHTVEADRYRFYLDEMDRDQLIDFLLTGRAFRHYRVGYDYYKPERWSPLNTFYSRDVDNKYPQHGDYIGRLMFYTPSQVNDKYGYLLTKTQKEKILRNDYYKYYGDEDILSFKEVLKTHFGRTEIVPHKDYHKLEFIKDLEDTTGIPFGERTYKSKTGDNVTVPVYMSDYTQPFNTHGGLGSLMYIAKQLNDDILLRDDLIPVIEAYWVSYKKVGYLTYTNPETGGIEQEIVTDDVLPEMLKELGIKNLNNVTLDEFENDPKPNTIVWDYIREVWKGVKLKAGTILNDDIYIDVKPLEYQIKGDSNVFDTMLPVAGVVDTSLALKMQPAQIGHNIAMNQIYNMLEKEIGLFYIFDVNFLPSEYKEWGDTEETLLHLKNVIKDTGLFGVDARKQNIKDGGAFNQFAPVDLSYSSMISNRMQLAEFYKQKAFEQVGFNPQRLGQPIKYETAEGIRQSQTASFAQTEIYYDKFSQFKKRALEMHLSVAQWSQKNNKDITVYYTKSDGSKAFLKFTDSYFSLRKLGILPVSNAKHRKELETFKQFILQNNTMGSDELALAELWTSDTFTEIIESARQARLRREKDAELQHQRQKEILDQQIKAQKDEKIEDWKLQELSKQRDRENRIDVKRIDALGRAADNNADKDSLDFITKQADLSIKKEQHEKEYDLKKAELEVKKKKADDESAYKWAKLQNDIKQTEARLRVSKDNKYIAEINKN